MKSSWVDSNGVSKSVVSPVSLIVTAYGPVEDVRQTVTPQLKLCQEDSVLVLIDLANGKQRMGASVLCQVYSELGQTTPDLESTDLLKSFWNAMRECKKKQTILAYQYEIG